jgi:hypothetical protein
VLGAVLQFGFLLNKADRFISLAAVVIVPSYTSHEFCWKAMLLGPYRIDVARQPDVGDSEPAAHWHLD